jgi:phosphoglycerate kinase
MSFSKQTIKDVPLEDKIVLMRADYNVPLVDGQVDDDLRIRASLPTLRYLQKEHCKIVIISHLGRPDGTANPALSLQPVAERLQKLLGHEVRFLDVCQGDKVTAAVRQMEPGDVLLLENVRFHPEEEANDTAFAKSIVASTGARYFVQDGFGVVHRAHATTEAITHFLPSVAGLLLEREVTMITRAMKRPKRPLYAVLGGAKVSDKIPILEQLIDEADRIFIGGAMANTFWAHKGAKLGKSKVEPGQASAIDAVYAAAHKKVGARVHDFIALPSDMAVAREISPTQARRNVSVHEVADDDIALDIGDNTIEYIAKQLPKAGTVIWNGTMGYAELDEFAHGSARVALTLASHPEITSIIGGGDTADFVLKWDGSGGRSFTHVSTGGGASLELMAGEVLPGIECLMDKQK